MKIEKSHYFHICFILFSHFCPRDPDLGPKSHSFVIFLVMFFSYYFHMFGYPWAGAPVHSAIFEIHTETGEVATRHGHVHTWPASQTYLIHCWARGISDRNSAGKIKECDIFVLMVTPLLAWHCQKANWQDEDKDQFNYNSNPEDRDEDESNHNSKAETKTDRSITCEIYSKSYNILQLVTNPQANLSSSD